MIQFKDLSFPLKLLVVLSWAFIGTVGIAFMVGFINGIIQSI